MPRHSGKSLMKALQAGNEGGSMYKRVEYVCVPGTLSHSLVVVGGQLASYRLNVYENEIGTGDKIQTLYRTDSPVKLD